MSFMDPGLVLNLAIVAARLSGYSLPDLHESPLPAVMEVSSAQMYRILCGDATNPEKCDDIVGHYNDGDDVIVVDSQWAGHNREGISEESVLVHELTHWLQAQHGYGGTLCPHVQAREVEAYRIQNRYIREIEHGRGTVVAPVICMDLPMSEYHGKAP